MPSNTEVQKRFEQRKSTIDAWLQEQLKNLPSQTHLSEGLIRAIHEQLLVQERFYVDMNKMQNMLELMKAKGKLSATEIQAVGAYQKKLDALINAHQQFMTNNGDITTLLQNPATSPEGILNSIQKMYDSSEFKKFLDTLAHIAPDQPDIDAIYGYAKPKLDKNTEFIDMITVDGRTIPSFSIMPAQLIPRMKMPLETIQEKLTSLEKKLNTENSDKEKVVSMQQTVASTLESAIPETQRAQLLIGAAVASKIAEKQMSDVPAKNKPEQALRNILGLNINTSLQKGQDAEVKDFPAYLQTLLVKAYPNMFAINNKGEITVKIDQEKDGLSAEAQYRAINKALGINITDSKVKASLNPANFNAQELDNLYKQDQNPLWIVLRSTKPVDNDFTATQKIQAYIEIAQEFRAEKLGKKDKYRGAYDVAQVAVALAKAHPECSAAVSTAFGPESDLGKWIIKKGRSSEDKERIIEKLTVPTPSKEPLLEAQTVSPTLNEVTGVSEPSDTASFISTEDSASESDLDTEPPSLEDSTILKINALEEELQAAIAARKELSEKHQAQVVKLEHENRDLSSQLGTAQEQLSEIQNEKQGLEAQIKELQSKNDQLIQEQKDTKKSDLSTNLNAISKAALNQADRDMLAMQINDAQNLEDLRPIEKQLQTLNKLISTISEITSNLAQRDGVFSSAASKKINAINTAFESLSLKDKLALAEVAPEDMKSKMKEKDNISSFLQVVNKNRGFIAVSPEATSFKEFKEQMSKLKGQKKEEQATEEQKAEEGSKMSF